MKKININNKIRFECQGSSNCCVSRGSYGFVYLSKKDLDDLTIYFDLKQDDFIKLYCDKTDGFLHFKEKLKNGNCQFLTNKRCSIYKSRPTQCRTWPFWSENMSVKKWNNEISNFCPGIGRGSIIKKDIIKRKIKEDDDNEKAILKEQL